MNMTKIKFKCHVDVVVELFEVGGMRQRDEAGGSSCTSNSSKP